MGDDGQNAARQSLPGRLSLSDNAMFTKIRKSVHSAFSDIKGSISSLTSPVSTVPDRFHDSKPYDRILRQILAIESCEAQEESEMIMHLKEVDEEISQYLSIHNGLVEALKIYIADKEREWQDHTSALQDDVVGLKEVSWSGWPVLNKMGAGHYHYDFFISYRVSSDSIIARELRLQLILRGFTVFLDQEELKDGEVGSCAFMVSQAKKTLAGLENRIRYWTETVSSCSVVGFGRMFGKDEELERQFYVGTGKLDFSGYPRERASSSGESEGILVCHQSAFTTLVQVTKLKTRVDHPNPSEGFEDSTIDEIAKSLDTFEELHKQKATLRSHLYFVEMGYSDILSSEYSSLHLLEKWASSELELKHIVQEMFSVVKIMIEGNKTWHSYTVSEMRNKEEFAALLLVLASDKLKELTLRDFNATNETAYFMQKTLGGSMSLQKFTFESPSSATIVPKGMWKFLESLPALNHISLNGMTEFLKDDVDRLISFLKTHPNVKGLNLTRVFSDPNLYEDSENAYQTGDDIGDDEDDEDDDEDGDEHDDEDDYKDGDEYDDKDKDKSVDEDEEPEDAIEFENHLPYILEEIMNLELETLELNSNDCKFSVADFVASSKSLKNLLLEGYRIDGTMPAFAQSLRANKSLKKLDLTEEQAILLSALKTTNIEALKMNLCISDVLDYPQEDLESIREKVFDCLGASKSISSLVMNEPQVNCTTLPLIAKNLSKMKALEFLHIDATVPADVDKAVLFLHLAKCHRLQTLKLTEVNFSSEDADEIVSLIRKSSTLSELIIPGCNFGTSEIIKMMNATKGKSNLRKIDIQGTIYGREAFDAIHQAFLDNNSLIIYFDYSEDINSLVKHTYLLPAIQRMSNEDFDIIPDEHPIELPVISFSKGSENLISCISVEDDDGNIIAARERILSRASELLMKQKEYLSLKDIAKAVETLGNMLKQPANRLVYRDFSAKWPVPLNDPNPSVYFLDSIVASRKSASVHDQAIIRELKLRLLAKRLKPNWLEDDEERQAYSAGLAEFDDAANLSNALSQLKREKRKKKLGKKAGGDSAIESQNAEKIDENAAEISFGTMDMDGLSQIQADSDNNSEDANDEMEVVADGKGGGKHGPSAAKSNEEVQNMDENWDGLSDSYQTDTSSIASEMDYGEEVNETTAFTVKNMPYPQVTMLSEPRNLKDDYDLNFPDVVTVFVSEHILEDIKSDEYLFWSTIQTWQYLLRCSEEGIFTVIPVYIATKNANSIIGTIRSQLLHQIYMLGRDIVQKHEGIELPEKLKVVRMAIDAVEAWFKLQGMVIDKIQLIQHACEKIIKAAMNVSKNRKKMAKIISTWELEYPGVFDRGFENQIFELAEDIKNDNIGAIKELLKLHIFKHFFGYVSIYEDATDIEYEVMEALKNSPSLESVKFVGKNNGGGERVGALSKAVASFAEVLRKRKLKDITLHLEIEDKKAAPVFSKAIAQHGSLKTLSLKGFTKHYFKDICLALVDHKSINVLELYDEVWWSVPDESVEALCELLKQNREITQLNIENCSFTTSQCVSVANAFRKNRTIRNLNVADGGKTDEGFKILIDGIASNSELLSLNCFGNDIGKMSFSALSALISRNNALETLRFGTFLVADSVSNDIGNVFNAIAKSSSLKELDFSETTFNSKRDIEALVACMQDAPFLEKIIMTSCNFSVEVSYDLILALTKAKRCKIAHLSERMELSKKAVELLIKWIEKNESLIESLIFQAIVVSKKWGNVPPPLFDAILKNTSLFDCVTSTDMPKDIETHLAFNRFRKIEKNTRDGWEFAFQQGSKELKDRFMQLVDFQNWIAEEAVWFLHKTCEEGDNDILKTLLEKIPEKALNSAYGDDKLTPLGRVICGSNKVGFHMLMARNAKPAAKIALRKPVPVFYYAAGECGNVEFAKMILASHFAPDPWERVYDIKIRRNMVALQTAALYGFHEAVEFLLNLAHRCEKRFLEQGQGSYLGTSLFYASRGRVRSDDQIRRRKSKQNGEDLKNDMVNHVRVLDLLINAGGENVIKYTSVKGRTPLDVAVQKSNTEIQEALKRHGVEAGKDVDSDSENGYDDDIYGDESDDDNGDGNQSE
ncbi:hypothetical protein HDU97_009155 [Phlyctochytrium planicorne]|nr:hypothetical protein HDU97_009155 [Phlyctochytrium planicorne]